jgi:hypothetical protein
MTPAGKEPDQSVTSPPISERIQRYRVEIQRLVTEGIEHPTCELTQRASISKTEPKARADFLKLVQGLANAHLKEERVLVVGADRKGKAFVALPNHQEFDPAQVHDVLEKYLQPVPKHEVFPLEAEDGSPYVVVVIDALQNRPIVAKTDAKDGEGRTVLRKGDVWIKQGTGLQQASGEDFEMMIQDRVDAEVESRARSRFAFLRDEIVTSQQIFQSANRRIPTTELIYGKDEGFRLFVRDLIVTGDTPRFNMLVETFRDVLLDSWHKLNVYASDLEYDPERKNAATQHKSVVFLPALSRLTELGMLVAKHDGAEPWFQAVVALLAEVFESARRLIGLSTLEPSTVSDAYFDDYVGQGMLAVEGWIATRALAVYTMRRKCYKYTSLILKKLVPIFRAGNERKRPLLFVPFALPVEMPTGYAAHSWEKRVHRSWKEYFGNREEFVRASCELEFVLELNSYIGMGNAGNEATAYVDRHLPDVGFEYITDLWRYSLSPTVPLAEVLAGSLKQGANHPPIFDLSIAPEVVQSVLFDRSEQGRLDVLLGFLNYLQKTHIDISWSQMRVPHRSDWGKKIGPLLEGFRKRTQAAQAKTAT